MWSASTGLDHLDRPQQAGALDERELAADVDLGEVRDEPLAALARPPLGAVELHVGRVEVLLCAVALGADTDDSHGAGLAVHGGLLSVGGHVTPFRGIRPDRGEGPGLQGQGPQPLRAWRRTDRRQEDRDALPGSLAGKPPRVCRSVSDFSERPRDDVWVLHRECAVGPRSSHRDPGRIGPGGAPVSSMH